MIGLSRHIGTRVRAQYGNTALMFAAQYGHADCARLLLDAGADTNAQDKVRARAGVCASAFLRRRWGDDDGLLLCASVPLNFFKYL